MTKLPLDGVGRVGIVKDIEPHELNPLGWSDGKNVRFKDGKIIRMNGPAQVFGTPMGIPIWLKGVFTNTAAFWLYSSRSKLYATDGGLHTDVTRASGGNYTVDDRRLWNGGILANIPVITNGLDVPQMWFAPGLAAPLQDLSNWPAGDRVNMMKGYKNFLVGGALTRGGILYPNVVKWSHPAAPGTVPVSWDETDPTKLAGEVEIVDGTQGQIRDALELRDVLIIYKDNTTWGMQYTGGNSIFRFYPILTQSGILSNECVVPIMNGLQHCIATGDDLLLFDGQNTKSVLSKRMRTYLGNTIETTTADRSFLVHEFDKKEVRFYYPTAGAMFPNTSIVYNYEEDTATISDFDGSEISFGTSGTIGASSGVWNDDQATWDSDTSVWDELGYNVHFLTLVGIIDGVMKTLSSPGAFNSAFAERTGLAIVGQDRISGELKTDITQRTLVTRIWPKVRKGAVSVKMGVQEDLDGPITWQTAQVFTPILQRFLDFETAGRLQAVRFDWSNTMGDSEIDGYDLETALLGQF